jgi:trehalose synthase
MTQFRRLTRVEDYERHIGGEAVDRILAKAERLRNYRVAHINSTYYGGGVAELLSSLTLLMSNAGLRTEWRAIHGPPDFFTITKKIHNAMQGGEINLTDNKTRLYEEVVYENAVRNVLDHDLIVIHDPQPLPLIGHFAKRCPWVWRCHIDLTEPNPALMGYLRPFMEKYDAIIVTLKEYAQQIARPQLTFMPAIDPFALKNRELSDEETDERLAHYEIPTDKPLVVQISRFDRWKDPAGVIEAFKLARKKAEGTLVLLGNVATDDPEGEEVYEALLEQREERIRILAVQDSALVNALQKRAAVVLQKSLREGFGLTVSEALWKGTPVIGGNVGGIRYQIEDGVNGYLVSSIEEAADRMARLMGDPNLCQRMGEAGRSIVREKFLMTRLLEQYLDLFNAFEAEFHLRQPIGAISA